MSKQSNACLQEALDAVLPGLVLLLQLPRFPAVLLHIHPSPPEAVLQK